MGVHDKISETKRRLLEHYAQGKFGHPTVDSPALIKRPADRPPPLSIAQAHFLLHEERSPAAPSPYNESVSLRLKGPLVVDALEQSVRELIRKHEILRTTYSRDNGEFVQVIHPVPENFHLAIVDLTDFPGTERDTARHRYADEQTRHRFDLERGPLFRASLVRLSAEEHILFIAAHLSIIDGASVYQILPVELASGYRAIVTGNYTPLETLPLQFADFAYWQRQWLETNKKREQLAFWKNKLANTIPALNWPKPLISPSPNAFRGVIRPFAFTSEVTSAIKDLCHREGVTLFIALLGGFVALLRRYTDQEDIIVGTLSPSGRKLLEVHQLLGHFINPVALRFDLNTVDTFHQLVRHVQEIFLEAMTHDTIPMEVLEREMAESVDPSGHSFFSVGISLQPPTPEIPYDWTVTSMDAQSGGTRWNLYIAFIDRLSGILGRVQYNPDVFDESTIEQMWTDLGVLLEAASFSPKEHLSKLLRMVERQS